MTVLSDLVARLTLDSSDYEAGLEGAEKKTTSSMSAIGKKMGDMGRKMQKTGAIMTATMTLPIVAAGMKAVDMASDLEESRSKVQVVFGDMAGIIEEFSDSAATSLGMSSQEALAAAGTYGNLFRSMEIGLETSTEMSTGLVTLAADLASFNNIDPTVALDKLRAGLTGEAEPLKSLGINLNQATIKAKAMELGLISAGGELTAAAKAQAVYALMLEQTTLAQGDFARTSDGMANQTRIMKAQLANLTAEMGTQLLPIALKIVQGISGIIEKFTNLPEPVKTGILVFLGVVAALGPLISIIGTVMTAVSGLMGAWGAISGAVAGAGAAFTAVIPAIGAVLAPILPIIIAIAAIIAVIALLATAWKNNWGDIQGKTKEAGEWIKATIIKVGIAIKGFVENIKEFFDPIAKYFRFIVEEGDYLNDWLDHIPESIQPIVQKIGQIFSMIIDKVKSAFDIDWGELGRKVIDGIVDAIRDGIGSVVDAAVDMARNALEAAKDFLGIQSGSKKFAFLGEMSIVGYADELKKTNPIEDAMNVIARATSFNTPQAAIAVQGVGSAISAQPSRSPEPSGGRELKVTQNIYNQVDAEKILGDIMDLLEVRR